MKAQIMTIGNQVLIPSNLTTDPANRRGNYGKIKAIDGDILTIEFKDGTTAKYMDDAVEPVTGGTWTTTQNRNGKKVNVFIPSK